MHWFFNTDNTRNRVRLRAEILKWLLIFNMFFVYIFFRFLPHFPRLKGICDGSFLPRWPLIPSCCFLLQVRWLCILHITSFLPQKSTKPFSWRVQKHFVFPYPFLQIQYPKMFFLAFCSFIDFKFIFWFLVFLHQEMIDQVVWQIFSVRYSHSLFFCN